MNSTSTVSASMPSTNQSCISSILTLRGFFTLFDTQRQAIYMNASASGTVINGCLEQLLTSSLNLSADRLSNSASTTGPFWATTTPLIFVVAITVTLAYVLFLMTLMSRIRRPWLQRCAILSVAVSLTLAAVLMWQELERQHTSMFGYNAGRVKDIRANTALKVPSCCFVFDSNLTILGATYRLQQYTVVSSSSSFDKDISTSGR